MKKTLLVFLTFALTVSAYCVEFSLSAGGGLTGIAHRKQAEVRDEFKNYEGDGQYGGLIKIPTPQTIEATQQGFFDTDEIVGGVGAHGFFDVTYVEVNAAFLVTRIEQTVHIPDLPNISSNFAGSEVYDHLVTQVYFSMFGKYPFKIKNSAWTIFPLIGATYEVALSEEDDRFINSFKKVVALGYEMPNLGELLNSLWIKAGVGADYSLEKMANKPLFLRTELLYGLKLPNNYESDTAGYWEDNLKGMSNGLTLSLALAYKIKSF
ncbi:hypothetical protein TREPR_1711 [Treponema primitia ZAS-2]|uniref:Outer membrane protein beta-barrel domain-containing protein n=1 Tax=Treponema primitia (strain ATCC BAA-887 / DSM 12427 / ZAS-2) TaxID=545694 RepID=F5YMV7_TREPZ|nr:hypothetical protein [Treponema primitia]AEF85530.1 hypothetical protein TREPR_1711 [Treponema primitia ZAS-2]